jgi:hypothetical protein
MEAHKLFDKFWKSGAMTRGQAYQWLQKFMEMSEQEAHIGNFGAKECLKLIEKLENVD